VAKYKTMDQFLAVACTCQYEKYNVEVNDEFCIFTAAEKKLKLGREILL
jgi:hypothetical protein